MASWYTSSSACGVSAGYTVWVRDGEASIRLDTWHCGSGYDTPMLSPTELASIRSQMDAAGVSEVIICCVPFGASGSSAAGSVPAEESKETAR
jgi:hypothetical protein